MSDDRRDFSQRRRYSLDGGSGEKPNGSPAPKAPAAPVKPVNTSTFLTRIANTAVREAGGAPPASARPGWMSSIDHSSPAANLNSRLRWVETAFKAGEPQGQKQNSPQPQSQNQAQNQQVPIANAGEFKTAVGLMRKRMQNLRAEIDILDRELLEIEQKMN